MTTIYISLSFASFIGGFLLIIAFNKDFKKLTTFQKFSILFTVIAIVSPMIIGTINGFINH
ncbi:hypothetical protein [Companilactobacillus sp. RD055328]|uniref:hypothetical protein n=1 Tax=Companilactobacillus sp. RD055328 TaxID=2916634 RepID=UPI001FC841AF|nr:hypothetical protein [Companilactobacillus sp. RD055328]